MAFGSLPDPVEGGQPLGCAGDRDCQAEAEANPAAATATATATATAAAAAYCHQGQSPNDRRKRRKKPKGRLLLHGSAASFLTHSSVHEMATMTIPIERRRSESDHIRVSARSAPIVAIAGIRISIRRENRRSRRCWYTTFVAIGWSIMAVGKWTTLTSEALSVPRCTTQARSKRQQQSICPWRQSTRVMPQPWGAGLSSLSAGTRLALQLASPRILSRSASTPGTITMALAQTPQPLQMFLESQRLGPSILTPLTDAYRTNNYLRYLSSAESPTSTTNSAATASSLLDHPGREWEKLKDRRRGIRGLTSSSLNQQPGGMDQNPKQNEDETIAVKVKPCTIKPTRGYRLDSESQSLGTRSNTPSKTTTRTTTAIPSFTLNARMRSNDSRSTNNHHHASTNPKAFGKQVTLVRDRHHGDDTATAESWLSTGPISSIWESDQTTTTTSTSLWSPSPVTLPQNKDETAKHEETSTSSNNNDSITIMNRQQIDAMTVVQLKHVCAQQGLIRTGNKADLRQRLYAWQEQQRQLIDCERQQAASFHLLGGPIYQSDQNMNTNIETLPRGKWATLQDKRPTYTRTKHSKIMKCTASTSTGWSSSSDGPAPNSLAEWARTVDLEPLLHRREAIHQEKRQGKRASSAATNNNIDQRSNPQDALALSTKYYSSRVDYLAALNKVFFETSQPQPYSKVEVQSMYLASKEADQNGDVDEALQLLYQLKDVTPQDARIYRRIARLEHEANGDLAAAHAVLHEGLRRHPRNAYLWHGLAQLPDQSLDRSIRLFQRAIVCDPSLPHPYHALGTLQHSHGRIADAMKTLQQGLNYCPKNHRLHHAMGDLYRDAKMLDMATKAYQKALMHSPPVSQGFAYTALAYVAYEEGRYDSCRTWLHQALKVNQGRHANGWVALAQFEESMGNIDAARAACVAGLSQYELFLLQQSHKRQQQRAELKGDPPFAFASIVNRGRIIEDPVSVKNEFLKAVPVYRSGDRFFNVYRNWARLEERYGNPQSVRHVYERGSMAFPLEYRLTLDWAEYYRQRSKSDDARKLYAKACLQVGHRHSRPYRLSATYEMSMGQYAQARSILFQGAKTVTRQATDGSRVGLTELYYTWAVCEWHLGKASRAEVLFDHALRTTNSETPASSSSDSIMRAAILYALARLEYDRDELLRAQHCVALCLQEPAVAVLPEGGYARVWDLWSDIAMEMDNPSLAEQCHKQATLLRQQHQKEGLSAAIDAFDPTSRTASSLTARRQAQGRGRVIHHGQPMERFLRRDPWHHKLFPTTSDGSIAVDEMSVSWMLRYVHLPSSPRLDRLTCMERSSKPRASEQVVTSRSTSNADHMVANEIIYSASMWDGVGDRNRRIDTAAAAAWPI